MLNKSLPINLRSLNGKSYLGNVYISKTQKAEVLFDTGSGWLVVTSDKCDSTCKTKAYNMAKSPNGKIVGNPF